MSGKTWSRLSNEPETRNAFEPNFATLGIVTEPFQILVSIFGFCETSVDTEGVVWITGDLWQNKANRSGVHF